MSGTVFVLFAQLFLWPGVFLAFAGAAGLARGDYTQQSWMKLGMGLTFAFVGIALTILGQHGRREYVRTQRLKAANPEQPWLWREDWANAEVRPVERDLSVVYGLMGALCILVSSPGFFHLGPELARDNFGALGILIFPTVGLLMIRKMFAERTVLRVYHPKVSLGRNPIPIGGTLQATLRLARPLASGSDLLLRLSNVRESESGSGDSRSRTENILWQDVQHLHPTGTETEISVEFDIPAGAQAVTEWNKSSRFFWRLEAISRQRSVSLNASFELPVFNDPNFRAEIASPESEARPSSLGARMQALRPEDFHDFRLSGSEGNETLHFPATRGMWPSLVLALFGAFFFGAGAAVGYFAFWKGRGFMRYATLPIVIPFLAVGGLTILYSLYQLFLSMTLSIEDQGGVLRTRWLLFSSEKRFSWEDVSSVDSRRTASSGRQAFYEIRVKTTDGRAFPVTKMIGDPVQAEWVVSRIRAKLPGWSPAQDRAS